MSETKKSKPKINYGNRGDQLDRIAEKLDRERKLSGDYYRLPGNEFADNFLEICRLSQEREEAVKRSGKSKGPKERRGNDQALVKIQRDLIRAYGLRPCGARDCIKILPTDRPRLKYCPDDTCRKRESNARSIEKDPDAGVRAQEKHFIKEWIKGQGLDGYEIIKRKKIKKK